MATAATTLPDHWRIPFENGFSLLPIARPRKEPLGKWKAFQTARASEAEVRSWAAKNANIGIATGAVSGAIVLDLDDSEAIAEAERRGLPLTVSAKTPRGHHLYFAHPGFTLGNRARVLPGWDIRGDGGFVVAPGSYFVPTEEEIADGKIEGAYEWENPPGLFDLAPIPAWLLQLLDRDMGADRVRRAPKGTRNDTLNREAFKAGQNASNDTTDASAAKERLRQAASEAGLGAEEAEQTISSGFAAGQRNARRKEPSEDDCALAFTARHGGTLRFDHDAGRWYEWNTVRWQPDTRHRAFSYAREVARDLDAGGKANFAGGVERFARAAKEHAVNADIWDADPMLLGTPGGTVDLHTGALLPPQPDHFITKLTRCTPAPGKPERWLRFLDESLNSDAETIRFIQQWAGYCLTGDTREHALAFVYGPGGNGKSVLLNTLIAIMGDYAVTAAMETFTASRHDRHSTELAMLRGARLVTASETEEGRAWAEAKIKALTGGDPITARFMRQDNFTFRPQFKLTIAGNHAPQLANVDEAMRRRFNIVPFLNVPANPDRELEANLAGEHGQILAWAIDGCLDWQTNGLVRASVVRDATADYFEQQDLFGQWIAERCLVAADKWELATPLFNSWREFAREAGDEAGSIKAFSSKLNKRGFLNRRATGGYRKYDGLSLRKLASDGSDG